MVKILKENNDKIIDITEMQLGQIGIIVSSMVHSWKDAIVFKTQKGIVNLGSGCGTYWDDGGMKSLSKVKILEKGFQLEIV